ncbi:MAG: GNAT family N-acetyltransferase [Pleurocapsa sp. SU_5_0]|nr:GNAT family N-acetyltransferase [Pleurocapsa sp. SU_5_0]NJR47426.1 GNAT family N-acetyltransferase [Hyellaceae cyanobacterium CSU_1_1]
MNIFLETDRLILRNLTQDDVDDLVRLDSDPEVMRFINGGIATTREAIQLEKLYTLDLIAVKYNRIVLFKTRIKSGN